MLQAWFGRARLSSFRWWLFSAQISSSYTRISLFVCLFEYRDDADTDRTSIETPGQWFRRASLINSRTQHTHKTLVKYQKHIIANNSSFKSEKFGNRDVIGKTDWSSFGEATGWNSEIVQSPMGTMDSPKAIFARRRTNWSRHYQKQMGRAAKWMRRNMKSTCNERRVSKWMGICRSDETIVTERLVTETNAPKAKGVRFDVNMVVEKMIQDLG